MLDSIVKVVQRGFVRADYSKLGPLPYSRLTGLSSVDCIKGKPLLELLLGSAMNQSEEGREGGGTLCHV